MDILRLLGAFAGGMVLSLLFGIFFLKKRTDTQVAAVTILRQIIGIAYLAVLFFFGRKNGWNIFPPLVGAAVGFTLPSLFVTARLLKDSRKRVSCTSGQTEDTGIADNTKKAKKTDKADETEIFADDRRTDRSEEHHG